MIDPIEGVNASVSLHVSATGNYFEPRLGSSLIAGASLGYWWLSAIALKIFGWEEFAVRFFSALSGLAMIFLSALSAKRFPDDNSRKSWLAASISASMTICFVASQIASPNSLLAFLASMIMFGLVKSMGEDNSNWLMFAHVGIILSFVLKGYDTLVLAVLAVLIFCCVLNDYNLLVKFLCYMPGIVTSILSIGIYLIMLIAMNPLILHFMRCEPPDLPALGVFGGLTFVLGSFMPWQGFIIRAIYEVMSRAKYFIEANRLESEFESEAGESAGYGFEQKFADDQEVFDRKVFYQRFFLIVWAMIFGIAAILTGNFLSLASCVVPFAALLGDVLDAWLSRERILSVGMSLLIDVPLIFVNIFVILPLGIIFVPILRASVISLVPWAGIVILFVIAAWYYAKTRQILKWSRNVMALALFALMPLSGVIDLVAEVSSIRVQGLAIQKLVQKDDVIVQYYENHPSMFFYTYRDSSLVNAPLLPGVAQRKFVTNEQTLSALWRGKARVFLLLPAERQLDKVLPANVTSIAQTDSHLLLSNK